MDNANLSLLLNLCSVMFIISFDFHHLCHHSTSISNCLVLLAATKGVLFSINAILIINTI